MSRPHNRLLASMPAEDFARIRPYLRTIDLEVREVVQESDQLIEHVVFPNNGMVSITATLADGEMLEVATVGDEGLVGADAIFSERALGRHSMVQVPAPGAPTTAEVMPVVDFRREYTITASFRDAVNRYMQGLLSMTMRSTACFGFHAVQERAARWLLLTHDRVRADEFQLSHEFLALMLGASRPTVTVAAGVLKTAGLIDYVHGRVTIRDRAGLEAAACSCYETVRADFERLGL